MAERFHIWLNCLGFKSSSLSLNLIDSPYVFAKTLIGSAFTEGLCWNKGTQEDYSMSPYCLGTPTNRILTLQTNSSCYQSLQRMSEFQMLSFFNIEYLIINIVTCGKARGQNPKMPKKKTLRVQRRTTRGLRLYWRLARKNAWTASPTCRAAAIALW